MVFKKESECFYFSNFFFIITEFAMICYRVGVLYIFFTAG